MSLAPLQKAAAQAIVNIFETGTVRGNYGDVTLIPGDSGQLTYGRSQTTLASGNLFLLIQDYCGRTDGEYSAALKPYLAPLEARDPSLNNDLAFRGLLKDAGGDPVMQEVQDAFFDRIYWDPAVRSAEAIGAQTALGTAIVYDSTVHGSWATVRDLTRQRYGELADIGEDVWMSHYVDTRREWLANFPNPLLHKTVYRMDAFKSLIAAGNWKLALPFTIRGTAVTADQLTSAVPVNVPAETPRRLLSLKSPPLAGDDVGWLQQRLTQAGLKVDVSGTFDEATDKAVRAFQKSKGLKADGVVGPVTRAALEDLPVLAQAKPNASDPMPAVAPPPRPAPAPPKETPMISPAAPAGETAVDLKQHVSHEVSSAVQKIQGTIHDEHRQIADKLPTPQALQSIVQQIAGGVKPGAVVAQRFLKGHPEIAAAVSAITLALTETRDALAWVQSGPFYNLVKPILPTQLPSLPQSVSGVPKFLSNCYTYLHAMAAAAPNEWVFRARVAAFVLLCYAVYRLFRKHPNVDMQKLETDLARAQQTIKELQSVAK